MKKKIFQKILLDINGFFIIILLSIGLIVWVIQAVNFLDFVSEDGHGLNVYFYYTFLNFPKILSAILPFVFFISLFNILTKYESNNELLIFWTNGIKKKDFVKVIIRFSLIYWVIQILLTSLIVPASQNKARSFIRASTIDFFPSLIKEKKFIDTVEGLTIFVGKKDADGKMFNIFLKDQIDDFKSQIILAKSGIINVIDGKNYLSLNDGRIINIEDKKIITFTFKNTNFNLSKFATKTTTWPKIQEHNTYTLFSCIVNTLSKKKILKENFYLRCGPNFYYEVIEEFLKRIYLPIYIPIIALIACFLISQSKENYYYSKLKIAVFSFGILVLLLSEMSIGFAHLNKFAFIIFLIAPFVIYTVVFNIFKSQVEKI